MIYNKMTLEQQEDFKTLLWKQMFYKVQYHKGKQHLITFETSYHIINEIINQVISQNDNKHLYRIRELVKHDVFNHYN